MVSSLIFNDVMVDFLSPSSAITDSGVTQQEYEVVTLKSTLIPKVFQIVNTSGELVNVDGFIIRTPYELENVLFVRVSRVLYRVQSTRSSMRTNLINKHTKLEVVKDLSTSLTSPKVF